MATICATIFSCAIQPVKMVHPEPIVHVEKKAGDKKLDAVPVIENADQVLTLEERTKYAYEVGLDPAKELSPADLSVIAKRKKVRNLERTLDSQQERLMYSKVLPWLKDDDEKVAYLSIPSIEGRQAWVNKNKIWNRSKNAKDYKDVMESMDIAIGMPTEFVKKR